MNTKSAIKKLFIIAQKHQKILEKLAVGFDPNLLEQAVELLPPEKQIEILKRLQQDEDYEDKDTSKELVIKPEFEEYSDEKFYPDPEEFEEIDPNARKTFELPEDKRFKIEDENEADFGNHHAYAPDPLLAYLEQAAKIAGANLGITITSAMVEPTAGATQYSQQGKPILEQEPGYKITVAGLPKNSQLRQKYINTLKTQVKTQKTDHPNLSNMLSIIFAD